MLPFHLGAPVPGDIRFAAAGAIDVWVDPRDPRHSHFTRAGWRRLTVVGGVTVGVFVS